MRSQTSWFADVLLSVNMPPVYFVPFQLPNEFQVVPNKSFERESKRGNKVESLYNENASLIC